MVTKDSGTAIVEGCHEQVNQSILKKLVQNVFQSSDDTECCEKICFCCSTNTRGNFKFVQVNSYNLDLDLNATLSNFVLNLITDRYKPRLFNNKSPPVLLS